MNGGFAAQLERAIARSMLRIAGSASYGLHMKDRHLVIVMTESGRI